METSARAGHQAGYRKAGLIAGAGFLLASVLVAWPYMAVTDDSWYALVAGDQLSRLDQPYYEGVHDHPLMLVLGTLLAPLNVGTALDVLVVIGIASFVALLYVLFRLARALGGIGAGALAVCFALLSPELQLDAFLATIDIPFAALVLLAVVLVAESPRVVRWDALLALLAAGLLRPEAWPLALLYGGWLAYLGVRRMRLALVGVLVLAAPVIWLLIDLVVFGDALRALKVPDVQVEVFSQGGFVWTSPTEPDALTSLPGGNLVDNVGLAVKDTIGFGSILPALGFLTALWVIGYTLKKSAPETTASPKTVTAVTALVMLATLLLIDNGGIIMANRYAIAPALVFIAVAAASPGLIPFRLLVLGLAALIALYVGPNLGQIRDDLDQTKLTHDLQSDLASLSERAEVRSAVERCPALLVRATGPNRGWAQLGSLFVAFQFGQDWDQVRIRKGLRSSPRHSEFVYDNYEWTFRSPCLEGVAGIAQDTRIRGLVRVMGTPARPDPPVSDSVDRGFRERSSRG
jgi:hypothetical protein